MEGRGVQSGEGGEGRPQGACVLLRGLAEDKCGPRAVRSSTCR